MPYTPPEGFIKISEVPKRLGVSEPTARNILRRFVVPTFRDPKDSRVRLVRLEDLEKLSEIVPADQSSV